MTSGLLLSQEHHQFRFDPSVAPALTVAPGTRVTVRTLDCFCNAIASDRQRFDHDADLLRAVPGVNPVTGPISVEGALPGDTLVVRIERIQLGTLAPHAVTTVTPRSGGPTGNSDVIAAMPADTRILPLAGDHVAMPTSRGTLRLPLRPMIGSIGVADERGYPSLESHAACGGNMDCPDVTEGSTLLLPVRVPGALLSVGDVHAAMGDAEVTATALETSADVTLSLELAPREGARPPSVPRLETQTTIGSIGCRFGSSLEANLELAFADLLARLESDYALEPAESYELLGAAARVRVNQCVPGGWSSVHACIARDCLPVPITHVALARS